MSDQNNFNLYYSAIHSFEQCDYDTAVKLFIEAYNSDINRDNIIENLYNCFITPNQQAFYDSFESSKIESHVKFENTSIDFIPVSDTKYYIFDKIKCTFSKPFEFQLTNNNAYTAESLLIIDDADISVAIEALLLKNYMNIYIVLTDKNSKILSLDARVVWSVLNILATWLTSLLNIL